MDQSDRTSSVKADNQEINSNPKDAMLMEEDPIDPGNYKAFDDSIK